MFFSVMKTTRANPRVFLEFAFHFQPTNFTSLSNAIAPLIDLAGDEREPNEMLHKILNFSMFTTTREPPTQEVLEVKKIEDIKDRLNGSLSNSEVGGEMACFVVLPDPVNPGLFVEGLGTIGLPLSARDAFRIIKSSNIGPPNVSESTNTSNDVICEISSDSFKLRNPAWKKH